MDYYKILNRDEIHWDLQYQTGLNVDPKPFNPSGDCEDGGIYFSREDILAFLSYGIWLRKVTLPENEPVYENPGSPKKWKSHQIILGEREEITLIVIRRLVAEGANPRADNDYALRWAAEKGHLETVKYLVSLGCDPRSDNDFALRWAAEKGHLEMVDYLKKVIAEVTKC